MIKLLNTIVVNTEIEVSFTPEVKTYNIVTGFMSDNCRPFRVSEHIMIWITEEGYIGEIECIYPETVDTPLCSYSHDLSRKLGFPQSRRQVVQSISLLCPKLKIFLHICIHLIHLHNLP